MASNDATVSDEAGEYDDWIELYNNTSSPLSLAGYSLTDDENNLTKWSFPQGLTLAPQAYLILWADNDEEQGLLHINFKLSKGGETLLLVNADGVITNEVEFGEQETDLSYSRIPNGSGEFIIKDATLGFNNEFATAIEAINGSQAFHVYPNPVRNVLTIHVESANEGRNHALKMWDLSGKYHVKETIGEGKTSVQVGDLPRGMYFIQVDTSKPQKVILLR